MDKAKQVKTRKRVADHGEVFTAEREVDAMLDLVKDETGNIESRFLEPACGDGNFLAEILRRKLAVVKSRYKKSSSDHEKYAVVAVASIYGVDILEDNVEECRKRMFEIFDKEYSENCKKDINEEVREAVRFILKRNILWGDALTLKTTEGEPIIFSEWSLVNEVMLQRRDFRFDELLAGHGDWTLEITAGWKHDEEVDGFIPPPIVSFPLTSYRKVQQYE
jgi:SAM-dependent methyltransferase